jgi:hypothetical protein
MPVSSEYVICCELPTLTSTAGRTSCVFLAYVIPWINEASLNAIYSMHSTACMHATTDRSEVRKLYCTVEFVPVVEASKRVIIEVKSRCQAPSL